jgi:hypothetical protein
VTCATPGDGRGAFDKLHCAHAFSYIWLQFFFSINTNGLLGGNKKVTSTRDGDSAAP